jgi:glucan phosphoethanolaminetransferase (alkaline phosphatase superfamily)
MRSLKYIGMHSLRTLGPGFLVAALVVPNVISLWGFSPHPGLATDLQVLRVAPFAVHRLLLVSGLTALLVCGALAIYRWACARRMLHVLSFLILLELFYRLAYGGPVSPGLLRSVPETSQRETLELLAGHPALTLSLSLVMILAIYALIVTWSAELRYSFRLAMPIGVVSLALLIASLSIGMLQLGDVRAFEIVARTEAQGVFPFDIASAFAAVALDGIKARRQAATRAAFRFSNAHMLDAASRSPGREIYVILVGETSRRMNWSLFGYSRPTTPRLDAIRDELILFKRMTSNATNTILSLPLALTRAAPATRDVARSEKSIVTLLKQAGFETFWISNQERSGLASNPILQIAFEADHVSFPDDVRASGQTDNFDSNLLIRLDAELAHLPQDAKAVIFLHMEGSHFGYKQRYPVEFSRFPDGQAPPRTLPARQMQLVNEYDNSVYFTDHNVRAVIDALARCEGKTGLIFFSDHGERLFDNGLSDRDFGHGFPSISRQEIAIPFFLWLSPAYRAANSLRVEQLKANANSAAQLHNLFETIVDLTGVEYDDRASRLSLFSAQWQSPDSLDVLNLEEQAVSLPLETTVQ